LINVYVNGRQLASFNPNQTNKPSKEGYTFRIHQSDGLQPGPNVLDFVWDMKDAPQPDGMKSLFASWYVIRVDFNMIFREMHNQ
jgi:hypothetical protein